MCFYLHRVPVLMFRPVAEESTSHLMAVKCACCDCERDAFLFTGCEVSVMDVCICVQVLKSIPVAQAASSYCQYF